MQKSAEKYKYMQKVHKIGLESIRKVVTSVTHKKGKIIKNIFCKGTIVYLRLILVLLNTSGGHQCLEIFQPLKELVYYPKMVKLPMSKL